MLVPLDLAQAVLAAISVFVPIATSLIAHWSGLSQTKQLLELLETRETLIRRLKKVNIDGSVPSYVQSQLQSHLGRLDRQIKHIGRDPARRFFYGLASFEIFILVLVVSGYDLGGSLPFLEGLLSHSYTHIMLLMVAVALSGMCAIYGVRWLPNKYGIWHLLLWRIFILNFFLVVILTSIGALLWKLDSWTQLF